MLETREPHVSVLLIFGRPCVCVNAPNRKKRVATAAGAVVDADVVVVGRLMRILSNHVNFRALVMAVVNDVNLLRIRRGMRVGVVVNELNDVTDDFRI